MNQRSAFAIGRRGQKLSKSSRSNLQGSESNVRPVRPSGPTSSRRGAGKVKAAAQVNVGRIEVHIRSSQVSQSLRVSSSSAPMARHRPRCPESKNECPRSAKNTHAQQKFICWQVPLVNSSSQKSKGRSFHIPRSLASVACDTQGLPPERC